MKADTTFLRALRKELHFLKDEEKDKFIDEYRTKINERYKKGEEIKRIIGSFEPPKIIAEKIYTKQVYNEDRYNINNTDLLKTNTKVNWFIGTITLIPQLILFIISLILIITGIAFGISAIAACVLSWLNFDPLQAAGPALLVLGLLPLIGFLLFWIGKKLFDVETTIFKSIWRPLAKIKKTSEIKKGKKIAIIVCMLVFTILTLGGATGTFGGNKTIGYSAINGNLLHNQTETLNISKFTDKATLPIKISYKSLEQISWYDLTFVKDYSMDSTLEINRAFNTKESLKINFTIKKENDNFIIKTNMPWNLLVFNPSNNKFTLKYNPEIINFGV